MEKPNEEILVENELDAEQLQTVTGGLSLVSLDSLRATLERVRSLNTLGVDSRLRSRVGLVLQEVAN